MLQRLFRSLRLGVIYCISPISWTLLSHEVAITDAAANFLAGRPQLLCKMQLEKVLYVERSNVRINLIRLKENAQDLRISEKPFDDGLFKVRLTVNGKKETANVTFYKGFIFSIETRQHRKFYKDAEIKIIGVEVGKPRQSITHAIDRQEHGRDETL